MSDESTNPGRGKFAPTPMIENGNVIYSGRGRFSATIQQRIVDTKTFPELVEGVWTWVAIDDTNKKHVSSMKSAKESIALRSLPMDQLKELRKDKAEAKNKRIIAAANLAAMAAAAVVPESAPVETTPQDEAQLLTDSITAVATEMQASA